MSLRRFFESLSVKQKRQFISVIYHGSIIAFSMVVAMIGVIIGVEFLIHLAAAVMAIDLLTFRRINIVLRLQERLISRAVCPVCGSDIPLINMYQCHCGFTEVRHIFRQCRNCGGRFRWLNCECGASIEI